MTNDRTQTIRHFILSNVAEYPGDIAARTREAYGISRQAVNRHLQTLERDGLLEATGRTRSKRYRLRSTADISKRLRVTPLIEEDRLWREYAGPALEATPAAARAASHYAFTEIVNNVIDHADASEIHIDVTTTATEVQCAVTDDGAGLFARLAGHFELEESNQALLELAKGRATTLPDTRTGVSLFYIAKLVESVTIESSGVLARHDCGTGLWTLGNTTPNLRGTRVSFTVSRATTRRLSEIISDFASRNGELVRTHVPVALAGDRDGVVTRSQARRLLHRLDTFEEVILDFSGVTTAGRSFLEEVFRGFRQQHPGVALSTLNASHDVRREIRRAVSDQPGGDNITPSTPLSP